MSNIEHALLTRVVDTGEFHVLERAGVAESFFSSPEALEHFKYIKETFYNPATRGVVPSREMMRYRFPSFYAFDSRDAVSLLCQQLKWEKSRADLLLLAQDLMVRAEANPLEAIAALKTELPRLSSLVENTTGDISVADACDRLREQYEMVAQSGGVIGIPYPWHVMNEETQGMQDSQFLVLYGRPKSMKTWVAIDMAVHAYIYSRRRVLFYTREMSQMLLLGRVAARIARVDYKAWKNGRLQPELKNHVFNILRDLKEDEVAAAAAGYHQPVFVVITDKDSPNGGGVSWLMSKIREYQPDIVFVDGMYLMKDDRTGQRGADWKIMTNISRDLKSTAQEFDIPLVGVTQANRGAEKSKGEDLTELAFADAIGQDADGVFRVTKKNLVDEQTKLRRTELLITAPGLREGQFDGIVINGQPATNFDYLRTLTDLEEVSNTDYGNKNEGRGGGGPRSSPTFRRQQDVRVPLK